MRLKSSVRRIPYTAPGSAASSLKCSSRPWAFKKRRTASSAGNTEEVAPISAPMLAMVARWGTERFSTPSPKYSKTLPTPPFTESCLSSQRAASLADTPGLSFPLTSTPITAGILSSMGSPPMMALTSRPPRPTPSMPSAPAVALWLSAPASTVPGRPIRL